MYEFMYYGITPGAAENCTASTNPEQLQNCTEPETSLLNESTQIVDWASLEYNSYNPRSPRSLYNMEETGMAFNIIADKDGGVGVSGITMKFDGYFSFNGITIFSGNVLKRFEIVGYRENNIIISKEFFGDSTEFFANIVMNEVNEISIRFHEAEPFRYVHIYKVRFGRIESFDDENIIAKSMEQSCALSMRENPYSVLNLSIKQDGIFRLFQERQKIRVLKNGELKQDFFISKSTSAIDENDGEIEIESNSLVSLLDGIQCMGGMYGQNTPIANVLDDIFKAVPFCSYALSDDLKKITVKGHVPICSVREALIYVCAALGAYIDDSMDNLIRLAEIETELGYGDFNEMNVIENSTVQESTQRINEVIFTSHNFAKGSELKEEYSWYMAKNTPITVKFSEPLIGIKLYSKVDENSEKVPLTASQATVLEQYGNYCVVKNISVNDRIVVEGTKYVDNKNEVSCKAPHSDYNRTYSTIKIEDLTLISDENKMVQRFYSYYALSNTKKSMKVLTDNVLLGKGYTFFEYSAGNLQKIKTEFNGINEIEVI